MRCRTDDSAGSATPTPIAPGWPATGSWLRPDVIAIGAGLAMWARAGVLTGASIDQAHAVQQMRCGVNRRPWRSGAVRARRERRAQHGIRQRPCGIWRAVQNDTGVECGWNRERWQPAQVVGALQPVFGVRFDPRAQRHDGDTSRCAVAGRWQFAATQHLVDLRAAVAQQARGFDDIDLQWFKRSGDVVSLGCDVSLIAVSFSLDDLGGAASGAAANAYTCGHEQPL